MLLTGSDWPSTGHVPTLEPIAVARRIGTLIGQAKIKCLRQGSALWPESEGWEWILGRPKHGCHWPWQQKPELASWLQGTGTACHGPTTHSAASASLPCRFLSQNCHPSSLPEPLFRLLILQGLTPLHLPLLKLSPATQVFIRHLLPTHFRSSRPHSPKECLLLALCGPGRLLSEAASCSSGASLHFILGCPCAMPRCAQSKSLGESSLCA